MPQSNHLQREFDTQIEMNPFNTAYMIRSISTILHYNTLWLKNCHYFVLLYCGQTAGWVKMKLGTEIGLGPIDTMC